MFNEPTAYLAVVAFAGWGTALYFRNKWLDAERRIDNLLAEIRKNWTLK